MSTPLMHTFLMFVLAGSGATQDERNAPGAVPLRTMVPEHAPYGGYFRRTCAAEEHLLAGDLGAALDDYETAFASVAFAFARDVYIAAQVAACLRDDARTEVLLEACVLAGVPLEFASAAAPFAPFRGGEGHRRLAAREPQLLRRYQARIDCELKVEVEQLRFSRMLWGM